MRIQYALLIRHCLILFRDLPTANTDDDIPNRVTPPKLTSLAYLRRTFQILQDPQKKTTMAGESDGISTKNNLHPHQHLSRHRLKLAVLVLFPPASFHCANFPLIISAHVRLQPASAIITDLASLLAHLEEKKENQETCQNTTHKQGSCTRVFFRNPSHAIYRYLCDR